MEQVKMQSLDLNKSIDREKNTKLEDKENCSGIAKLQSDRSFLPSSSDFPVAKCGCGK